ncbi:MAG TPA: hypothetical protein PLZ55_09910 [bacterium]|nr:hypothetical protein [bacterium]HPO08970.1 hypothetical protein [bacterium]HQO36914.1 hypothetical protein [bacterium]HQP97142.1 hypothetical protein [bacterium]
MNRDEIKRQVFSGKPVTVRGSGGGTVAKKVRIGEIIESYWDDTEKCLLFTIQIDKSGRKVAGRIHSGFDHETQAYVPVSELKKKAKSLIGMVVYDQTGKIDPANITYEELQNIKFKISLRDMNVTAAESGSRQSLNSLLSRL